MITILKMYLNVYQLVEVNNSEWFFSDIYGYISLVAMLLDAIVNIIIQSAFIYDGVIFFHVKN
jgi:hypothetical protein